MDIKMSELNNADKPAHPVKPEVIQGNQQVYIGLTKREQFAAMAMQGLLAAMTSTDASRIIARNIASNSIEIADALLEGLEGGE